MAVFVSGATIVVAFNADTVYTALVGDIDIAALRTLLQRPGTLKLCYDLKALKYMLRELDIDIAGDVFDVQLVHYLLDPEARHTLESIALGILGYSPADNVESAAILWQLYPLMAAQLSDTGMRKLYTDVELPLVDVLVSMEEEGVRIDVDALKEYSAKLSAERDNIEHQIFVLAGGTFNVSSPKQLGEVLYERLNVTDKPPRTATKQYSTAEDVLVKLKDKHPIIPLILEYRSLNKLIGTYLDSFPKLINPATGRLHTVYNQTVTATGRLSSSNPNLQNIPIRTERGREIRKAFVARNDDYVLLAADYSQIELRIIASLANDRHMIDAFANHYDIHAATAAKIYGMPIDEVSKDLRRMPSRSTSASSTASAPSGSASSWAFRAKRPPPSSTSISPNIPTLNIISIPILPSPTSMATPRPCWAVAATWPTSTRATPLLAVSPSEMQSTCPYKALRPI